MSRRKSPKNAPSATENRKNIEAVISAMQNHLKYVTVPDLPAGASELLEALQRESFNMQVAVSASYPGIRREPNCSERVMQALEEADPVLAYCIVEQLGCDENEAGRMQEAIPVYVRAAEAYDLILGGYLPNGFRVAAEPALRRHRYRHGENATALNDWHPFKEDFASASSGYPTGIDSLDSALGGGLKGITVVGGDEASGKTTLCLAMMVEALRNDRQLGCVYYTVDQPKRQMYKRLLSVVAGADASVLRLEPGDRSSAQNRQIADAEDELVRNLLPRIRFVEKSYFDAESPIKLEDLIKIDEEFCAESDADRVLMIVDLFQSLAELNAGGAANEIDESLLALFQRFVEWSKTEEEPEGATIVLVSEVRKDRKELSNDDLRGSARLGSTPDNIILLWPTVGKETGQVVGRTLKVGKSRDGDSGKLIDLEFHHKIGRFSEPGKRPSTNVPRTGRRSRLPQRSAGKQL